MRALALALVMLPLVAFAADLTDAQRAEVEARIKPFGNVCLPGDECSGGAAGARASLSIPR